MSSKTIEQVNISNNRCGCEARKCAMLSPVEGTQGDRLQNVPARFLSNFYHPQFSTFKLALVKRVVILRNCRAFNTYRIFFRKPDMVFSAIIQSQNVVRSSGRPNHFLLFRGNDCVPWCRVTSRELYTLGKLTAPDRPVNTVYSLDCEGNISACAQTSIQFFS